MAKVMLLIRLDRLSLLNKQNLDKEINSSFYVKALRADKKKTLSQFFLSR